MLRKALGDCPDGLSYIETVPRVGYRFAAQVEQVSAAGPTLVIVPEPPPAPPAPPRRKSVAVLYFENLSGVREDEYFRDGMTEDVITELEKIRELRLVPRTSMLAFRDKPAPITQVGEQLCADFVMEGSVRRAGDRLRITARLAETDSGHSVWAERYDRRLEDVFAIQDEIAQSIALALRVVQTKRRAKLRKSQPATSRLMIITFADASSSISSDVRRWSLPGKCLREPSSSIQIMLAPMPAWLIALHSFICGLRLQKIICANTFCQPSRRGIPSESPVTHASLGLALFLRKDYVAAQNEFETALGLVHGAV